MTSSASRKHEEARLFQVIALFVALAEAAIYIRALIVEAGAMGDPAGRGFTHLAVMGICLVLVCIVLPAMLFGLRRDGGLPSLLFSGLAALPIVYFAAGCGRGRPPGQAREMPFSRAQFALC